MMAPGFRSRFAHPSRRRPIPGITESSTVEWQRAQVTPRRVSWSVPPMFSTVPLSPTTAFELQESDRRGRRVEVGGLEDARRQSRAVHLQAHGEGGTRADAGGHHLVHAGDVGPEGLVPEGVEAEDLAALFDERRLSTLGLRGQARESRQGPDGHS